MKSKSNKPQTIENKGLSEIRGGYEPWIVISFIFAIIGTFQTYPFIGLADGFTRWSLALEIVNAGKIQTDNLLSPIIPYIQAVTYKITNSFGLYTLLQAALFYMAIGALIWLLIGERPVKLFGRMIPIWIIVALLITVVPTVYVFPLMLTDSAPIFVLMVFSGWAVLSKMNVQYKALVLCAFSFLCVGIRINSLVMLLIAILIYVFRSLYDKSKECLICAGAILTGCIIGIIAIGVLSPSKYNASSLGMVWELVGEASNTNDDELITELGKYGDIEEAVRRYGEPYLNSIVWDNNPPYPAMQIAGEDANDITQIYLQEAIRHPVRFILNKWYYIDHTLGISAPLISSTRGVHGVDDRTRSMGGLETELQGKLRQNFFSTTDKMSVISLRPLYAILITLLLVATVKILKGNIKVILLFLFLAVAYYSSFCVNTQAFEYRYYAPTFYTILCLIVCMVMEIVFLLHNRVLKGDNG